MSQSQSRAERRQTNRGGGPPHPPRRDPMVPVYIGLVVVIALILLGFGGYNFFHNRDLQAKFTAANATPTPGPNASAKPVQIVDGTMVGKAAFPPGDSPAGGQGAPIDGISCETTEQVTMHVHSHLALFVNGEQKQIPPYVGMVAGPDHQHVTCVYWLHAHDGSGLIHVEAPDFQSPSGGPYTLGMFFDIWGQQLTRNQVGQFKGPVTAYVNGSKWDGDLHAIPLLAHQQITLQVGDKQVTPPNYTFPENE